MSRQNKVHLSTTNQAFESGKLNKQDFQKRRNARLTCPFHTLRPLNSQQTSTKTHQYLSRCIPP
ncbi:hypothetical protein BWR16_04465 [Vibrio sp. V01_P9A10T6]|nr:hypothetical protein BWR16_04465 [Vibrio sp. V01_P9A10T6]